MAERSALRAGCLLMAAGNASRFGENKLAACFDGQSLFSLALAAIPAEMFASRSSRSSRRFWRRLRWRALIRS